MRVRVKSQPIIHGLTLIMFCLGTSLMADDSFNNLPGNSTDRQQWVCDYSRARNDVLYLHCVDLANVVNDPLIMESEYRDNSIKYIPIWRRPDNENSAIKLVESVLCHQNFKCSVQLKSMYSSELIVNR